MDDAEICSTPMSAAARQQRSLLRGICTGRSTPEGTVERPFTVQIPDGGFGTGYYTRWEGDHANGLLRFDRCGKGVVPIWSGGTWRPSDLVDRLVYLGER